MRRLTTDLDQVLDAQYTPDLKNVQEVNPNYRQVEKFLKFSKAFVDILCKRQYIDHIDKMVGYPDPARVK